MVETVYRSSITDCLRIKLINGKKWCLINRQCWFCKFIRTVSSTEQNQWKMLKLYKETRDVRNYFYALFRSLRDNIKHLVVYMPSKWVGFCCNVSGKFKLLTESLIPHTNFESLNFIEHLTVCFIQNCSKEVVLVLSLLTDIIMLFCEYLLDSNKINIALLLNYLIQLHLF